MGQAYHRSPSEILRLTDPLTAFYLDRAVYALAGRIQGEMDQLKEDPKAHLKMPILLNKWGLNAPGQSGFADPRQRKQPS